MKPARKDIEIEAFVEVIWCPVWIVRSAQGCDRYGKNYTYAVAVAIPWLQFFKWIFGGIAKGIAKGLVADDARPLREKMEHARAGHKALLAKRVIVGGERIREQEG